MSLSIDSDPFDTLSLAETDTSDDFELVDIENDEVRSFAPSSIGSDIASTTSDVGSTPPSPQLDASRFHFPDPVPAFHDNVQDDAKDVLHHDDELHLKSSSICTLMASSQQDPQQDPQSALQQPLPPQPIAVEAPQPTPVPAFDLGTIEKMDFTVQQDDKRPGPSQPHRTLVTMAPKAAWLVALFAAVLLGFKSSTLLGFTPKSLSSHTVPTTDTNWNAKFASPPQVYSSASSIASQLLEPSTSMSMPVALAPSPSPAGLTVNKAKRPETKGSLPRASPRRSSSSSAALQNTAAKSKSLSVVSQASAKSSKVQRPVRPSNAPVKGAKNKRYAAFADQLAFNLHRNVPIFPPLAASSYLDNATTTSWAFWLAELDNYYQTSVRPAILAAKQQAYEAARLAQRYHQEQVLPAFACLREHVFSSAQRTAEFTSQYNQEQVRPAFTFVRDQAAQTVKRTAQYHEKVFVPAFVHARLRAAEAAKTSSRGFTEAAKRFSSSAQRTAEFTAQYHEEQLRPAFAFVREQAAETAKRTAEYGEKVLRPAVAQFRVQAVDAAKTTSQGLNKAAKRFSTEAAETVQQVKDATHIDLEALGIDDYFGFMLTTFKSLKQNSA